MRVSGLKRQAFETLRTVLARPIRISCQERLQAARLAAMVFRPLAENGPEARHAGNLVTAIDVAIQEVATAGNTNPDRLATLEILIRESLNELDGLYDASAWDDVVEIEKVRGFPSTDWH